MAMVCLTCWLSDFLAVTHAGSRIARELQVIVQDLTGDSKPEIICQVNGVLGSAFPNPDKPTEPFVWHAISPEGAVGGKFTHGLGVGDVNGGGAEWRLL